MRYSRQLIPTLKEDPSDAEVISHKLLLRAGMIRKLSAGIYNYLPLGLKALRKIEKIVREEMDRAGALEVLMPAVQPAELWVESGRWEQYGKELLRFKDRKDADFCIGPTHEEVITDIVRKEIKSYRQLPVNLYQIQTKFRDEIRPRFGLMRGREFIMKDAYSFDIDEPSAEISYKVMHDTYCRIFTRCGLDFRAVEADTGTIGGSFSHEFMVLAASGEDTIGACLSCGYAANIEKFEVKEKPAGLLNEASEAMKKVSTPTKRTIEEVSEFLNIPKSKLIKTLVFEADGDFYLILVSGSHTINGIKVKNFLKAAHCELAKDSDIERITGAPAGFAGPVGIKGVKIIADNSVKGIKNAATGANEKDAHLTGVEIDKDFKADCFADLRSVEEDDLCPRCTSRIEIRKGIEVGHIFKLGTKYSKALKAVYLDANGAEKEMIMGCYGIGVSRILSAAIEQNNDEDGIIFPLPIAPYEVIILPVNVKESEVMAESEKIYKALDSAGIDVLFDDRDERPGVKFKDSDLLGIPLRITIGSKNLSKGMVEIKERKNKKVELVAKDEVLNIIKRLIKA